MSSDDDESFLPKLGPPDVGVAMCSGTDVARESADIVLLGNDLVRFVATIGIARRTRQIIWQNFVGTVAVDAIGIALAAVGFLNPLLAAFIHVASEMTFILNSARLLPRRVMSRRNLEVISTVAGWKRASLFFRCRECLRAGISSKLIPGATL